MEISENRLQSMVENLLCPICQDYFKQAITLNCTHSFCYSCIDFWRKTRNECPVCRLKIESLTASLALDNLVSAYTNQEKVRTEIITEDKESDTCSTNHRRDCNSGSGQQGIIEPEVEEEEEDDWSEDEQTESETDQASVNSESEGDMSFSEEEEHFISFEECSIDSSKSSASASSYSATSEYDPTSYDEDDEDEPDCFDYY